MTKEPKKQISIALQGGGAHGAFAWGVMDRLLADPRIEIRGVSGTSAGGMNAAAVIQGLAKEGPELARATLKLYWESMSEMSKKISPFQSSAMDKKNGVFNLNNSFGYMFMGYLQGQFSPYDLNPKNKNPFEDFVRDLFDFNAIRESKKHKIFLGATHVASGKVKVFSNKDISADVMLASACLPFLFQAAKIDNEYYWDGGFIANPAIFPLIDNVEANDIFVIQLTKSHRRELPTCHFDIVDRLKEITYNGCLVHEMRAISLITRMIDEGKVKEGEMKRINMHVIKNEEAFSKLNLSSALNTDMDFLNSLFESGYKTADNWLKMHFDNIGKRNSNTEELFSDYV